MTLRRRLILVILTVVVVMGTANTIAFRLNRAIHGRVARLGRSAQVPLEASSLVGQALSIEGHWDGNGSFVASEIERLPWSRRPKLRGAVEAVDPKGRTLTLFGRRIAVGPEVEFLRLGDGPDDPLRALGPGTRAEVSCRIDRQGGWIARKIDARRLKSSNKVKGNVTSARLDPTGSGELEIHGLRIEVPAGTTVETPQGPLYRMELATRMTFAGRECLTAAQELLKEGYRNRREGGGAPGRGVDAVEDRLLDGYEGFARNLAESRLHVEESLRRAGPAGSTGEEARGREMLTLWLEPLEARRGAFQERVGRLLKLAAADPEAAQAFLHGSFEPFLQDRILPLVHAYHLDTEEELAGELQAIAKRSLEAARVVLATNVVGLVLAVGLGLVVSRSISRPVLALQEAAREVGRGHLEVRVDVCSRDELGVLASAFNRMTERLAASTVSVANLNNVIDSMAGALFLLDRERRVTGVNPAALALLGYEEERLVGRLFDDLHAPGERGPEEGMAHPSDEGIVSAVELALRKRDGETVPVSFSGAAMYNEDGTVRGFVCLALDLSERLRMERQVVESLREKELLLREVHHRVKNNLQVISSLLDLQSRAVSDPRSLEKFRECQDCILSMVFIHDQLYRAREMGEIDLGIYLGQIVANLGRAYLVLPERVRMRIEVEDARLDLDRALSCGLIVNELVTNALKHAFTDDESGEIRVACRRGEESSFVIEVSDSGRGFDGAGTEGDTDSLGLSLVRTLTDQLRGRIHFDNRRGAFYRIEFPARPPEEVA